MMRTRPGARAPPNLDYDRINMGSGRARGSSRRVKERAVRYGTEHKQATRQRIIETAGRRLKRDGIDGSGVATLMADAGLTNGAFYAHFAIQGRPGRHRGRRPAPRTARKPQRGGARPRRSRAVRA